MRLENLLDLYVAELQDVYNAERQVLKALPKLARSARSMELRDVLASHAVESQGHVARLERILKDLGELPGGEVCGAMQGLVAGGEELGRADAEDAVRDAGLILAAQKIEHYEIASYGALRKFAQLLRREQDVRLLEQTLEEEQLADLELSRLAEQVVNERAVA